MGALRSRNFRLLFTGMLISNSGNWMAVTAQGWLVTELAPDRASLIIGLIAMAFALPILTFMMVGGAVADRFPRMRLLFVINAGYFVNASLLAAIVAFDLIQVWMLIVFSFVNGLVLAFDSPVRNALLPDMVERQHLSGAVSLNSAAYTGAALVGPAIAGALIPLIGVKGVYVIAAVAVIAVLYALTRMSGVPEYAAAKPESIPLLRSIKEGLRYAIDSRVIFGVVAVSIVSGIFARSYQPLLVIFAREEFDVGSFLFGLMVAAPGLGTLAAAFILAARVDAGRRGVKLFWGTMGLGVVLILFSIMPWYAGGLPLLILAGACVTMMAANMATIVQIYAPTHLRGRLLSILMLSVIGVPAIGTLISGAIANEVGVRLTVGGAAVIMLFGVLAIYARNDELRTVD